MHAHGLYLWAVEAAGFVGAVGLLRRSVVSPILRRYGEVRDQLAELNAGFSGFSPRQMQDQVARALGRAADTSVQLHVLGGAVATKHVEHDGRLRTLEAEMVRVLDRMAAGEAQVTELFTLLAHAGTDRRRAP